MTIKQMNEILGLYGVNVSKGDRHPNRSIIVWYIHSLNKTKCNIEVFTMRKSNSEILDYVIKEYT
jgi:hypothetical protein